MSETMPKVSVVIPSYNSKDYIAACLESAQRQQLADIEIICVNDGSTDDSLGLLKQYQANDSRIRIIDKPNSGYGNTMNCGFDAARGEYIAILESDDFIADDMFAKLYRCAKRNDLDIAKADYYCFYGDGDNRIIEYSPVTKDKSKYNCVINPQEDYTLFDIDMVTWTGIYKTDFIRNNGIRYNETPGASYQDNGFWFQTLALARRVMVVKRAFYYYRQDNPNSSINSKEKVFCMNTEHSFIHDFIAAHPELDQRKLYGISNHRRFWNYRFSYKRIAPQFKEGFLLQAAEDYQEAYEADELVKEEFFPDEWSRVCDIMDDPRLTYRKLEGVASNPVDQMVLKYQLRRVLQTTQALEEATARQIIPFALKDIRDYAGEYGVGQLIARTFFGRHVTRSSPIQTRPAITYPFVFPDYQVFVDTHVSLDDEDSLLCWYRRMTGKRFPLKNPKTFGEKVNRLKIVDNSWRSALDTYEKVLDYAASHIDKEMLPNVIMRFDDIEAFENYSIQGFPPSFVLRLDGQIPWKVIACKSSALELKKVSKSYRQLRDLNLSFMSGHAVNNDNPLALLMLECSYRSREKDYLYHVCCVSGKPFLIIVDRNANSSCMQRGLFDMNWNQYSATMEFERLTASPVHPRLLDRMLDAVASLHIDSSFSCIDFLVVEQDIYFDNITFDVDGGSLQIDNAEIAAMLGDAVIIDEDEK